MLKRFLISLFAIIALLTFSACGQDNSNNIDTGEEVNINESNEQEQADSSLETEYPLTVTDASGEEVTFEEAPEKIVSTSPSETEILFALGLEDKIVGVSDYDDYPEEALEKPKVGGVVEPNVEAIIEAEPDVVIGGLSMNDDVVENLRNYGLHLYKTDANTVDEALENIIQMGIITDAQEEAEALVADMKDVIQSIEEKVADIPEEDKQKVYIEYNPGWTVGKGEFMNELIEIAGGINVAADTEGWVEVNEEKIIQDNPDVIVYSANIVDEDSGKQLDELIKDRSGWDKISAVEEDRMIAIHESVMSRIGPRLTDALQQIAEGIYPEIFEQ